MDFIFLSDKYCMIVSFLKKNRFIIFICFLILITVTGFSEENSTGKLFIFKYEKGTSSRILSKVHEDVFVNNILDHHAEILNRITVKDTDVKDNGSGILDATFATSEDSQKSKNGQHFTLGQEYKSAFERSKEGVYTIEDNYFMPTVRNVPVFPDRALKPGDTWKKEGYEAYDLRRTFHINKPFKVPFTADYIYKGAETDAKKKTFDIIEVQYKLYYESPELPQDTKYTGFEPATTMGFSHQTIYWNYEKGAIDHYNETFIIVIETLNGTIFKFQGTSEAEVNDIIKTSSKENIQQVQKKIDNMGLQNVSVTEGQKGLTISLEKIQFEPDSAILQESEKVKIKKIAVILNEYKKNDLLVTGYCALAGTKSERKELSEQRADSVADYLTEIKVRDTDHIFTEGLGAENPIATNETEEGRAKNRRVEITIMDK